MHFHIPPLAGNISAFHVSCASGRDLAKGTSLTVMACQQRKTVGTDRPSRDEVYRHACAGMVDAGAGLGVDPHVSPGQGLRSYLDALRCEEAVMLAAIYPPQEYPCTRTCVPGATSFQLPVRID